MGLDRHMEGLTDRCMDGTQDQLHVLDSTLVPMGNKININM